MIRAKAMKVSDNEDTYNTDLNQVNFISKLPKKGERMHLLTSKMHGGVITSEVTDVNWSRTKHETRYEFATINSTYVVVIDNNDLKDWEEARKEECMLSE